MPRKRAKKEKPYILSSLILSSQIRLILSLKTKTTHKSTQAKRHEKATAERSERIENGRNGTNTAKRAQNPRTAGRPAPTP